MTHNLWVTCLIAVNFVSEGFRPAQNDFASETCLNTYFSDWGSSGMKLYKAHLGDGPVDESTIGNRGTIKIKKLVGTASEKDLEEQLTIYADKLLARGKVAQHAWRIYATAGLRIHVKAAEKLWDHLRFRMSKKRVGSLFAECDDLTNAGCQTLPGATEALYEFSANYMKNPWLQSESRAGFISAGGASLQMGVHGVPKVEMERCLASLSEVLTAEKAKLVPEYDARRAEIGSIPAQIATLPGGQAVFLVSFLAIDGESRSCNDDGLNCDFEVGGINEMRKQFENFLVKKGWRENPCLEKIAAFPLKWGGDVFSEKLKGSYEGIANPEHSLDQCYKAIDEFLETDLSLRKWIEGGCADMVRPIEQWQFMTSLTRMGNVDPDRSSNAWTQRSRLFGVNELRDKCNKKNKDKVYMCGRILTDSLIARFLDKVGFDLHDNYQESSADWVEAPMALHGLQRGWCAVDSGGY